MQNTNTKLNRFLACLINWILVVPILINIVFWVLDKEPLGQKFFKTEGFQGKSKAERAVFGLLTFVIFITVVGLLANIYFWATGKDSIPVMLTKKIFKDAPNTTMPAGSQNPAAGPTSGAAGPKPTPTPAPAKPAAGGQPTNGPTSASTGSNSNNASKN